MALLMTIGGDIDTRGGGVVGGNADVGQDYTGRDNRPVNIYNQSNGDIPNRPQRHLNDSDRVDLLEFHMYGQGDYWPGVIRQQKQIIDQQGQIVNQQSELVRQNRNMMFMQITLFAVLTILVIVTIANLLIL